MPSPSESFHYSLTLWVWPSGLFPNRCIQYLKAKRLPTNVLAKIRIIPEKLEKDGIYPVNGLEKRPAGCTLPCLIVRSDAEPNDEARIITQASAVLEALEDLLPASAGYKGLRGDDIFETARARDIINMWSEVIGCAGFSVRHSHEWTLSWSGMTKDEQSQGAANDALREMRRRVQTLEGWRSQQTAAHKGPWLAGTAMPTIADFTVASGAAYMEKMYGMKVLEDYPLLKAWMGMYQQSEFFAGEDDVGKLERGESLEWAVVASA